MDGERSRRPSFGDWYNQQEWTGKSRITVDDWQEQEKKIRSIIRIQLLVRVV
jgi:hypothetical protein